jgi:hypothetical protein
MISEVVTVRFFRWLSLIVRRRRQDQLSGKLLMSLAQSDKSATLHWRLG